MKNILLSLEKVKTVQTKIENKSKVESDYQKEWRASIQSDIYKIEV